MTDAAPTATKDKGLWRDLTAYWILGLCNNYGYVVMLTAAHDIISKFEENEHGSGASQSDNSTSHRRCNKMSTSAVLLADIIPSFLVKLLAPFMPFWVHTRMALAIGLTVFSFLTVSIANVKWLAFLGIVFTSASCGIGESTLLAYSSSFNKDVVSTWSSGTGGAGIFGALSYTILIDLNLTPKQAMLVFLYVPTLEALAFWIILRNPKDAIVRTEEAELVSQDVLTVHEKIVYFFKDLLPFLLPLSLVYFAEYFINMGLYELVYFENIFITPATQYRWLSTDYQIGVFISRSSVYLIHFTIIWPMAILQCINAIIFSFEAVFFFVPNFWIIIVFVLWEGLLGGGAYVNTFYHMSKVIPPQRRQYAIGMVAQADSYGIIAAGLLAIPVHNAICDMDARERETWPNNNHNNYAQKRPLSSQNMHQPNKIQRNFHVDTGSANPYENMKILTTYTGGTQTPIAMERRTNFQNQMIM
ncbi:battenin-like [Eurosta solidaginis]|uniref:battenin-like n=1 Tax=Eurosta solidaginis TaxID=178769 RepID=UPI003530F9CB